LFLSMLDQFEQQGRHVSDKVNANNYAPAMFSKANGLTKARFAAAMDRLFAANKIHVGTYGRPSRQCYKITRGGRQRSSLTLPLMLASCSRKAPGVPFVTLL